MAPDFTKVLNPLYGYEAVQDQMQTSFKKSPVPILALHDFFVKKTSSEFHSAIDGITGSTVYEPERCSYTELVVPQSIRSYFAIPAFLDFIKSATGARVKDVRISGRRFGHRDFTLLHDDQDARSRLLFVYVMTSGTWDASSGGSFIFSFGDERAPLIIEPRDNTLVVCKTLKEMREFVKYVNHNAGKKNVTYLIGEFLLT